MMSEWLLEWVWIIFVQGPLLIIEGIDKVFSELMGFGIGNSFLGTEDNHTILIIYGILILVSILFSIYAIFIKFIKSRTNELEMKQSVVSTVKYTLINLVILILIPMVIILLSLLLDFISQSVLQITVDSNGIKGEEIAKKLYLIGYLGSNFDKVPIPEDFGPNNIDVQNNISYLKNYNYAVQIICSLVSMIVPLYLCWTFVQKYVEIFIFTSIMPLTITANFIDDGARFKILLKEVFGKFIIIIWCFIAFWMYKVFYSLLFAFNGGSQNFDTRSIIYTIAIIAINFSILLFTKLIGKSFDEKTGIIGTYKSSKKTYNTSRVLMNKQLVNRDEEEYKNSLKKIEDYQIENKKAIESLKAEVEIANKNNYNFYKTKDVNIFNEKMN